VGAKHYHPGPELFYVLEGTLAHELEDGSTHMMKVGAFDSNPKEFTSSKTRARIMKETTT